MEGQLPLSPATVDPYHHLQIAANSDGSITRLIKFPSTSPTADPANPSLVLTKDIPINQSNNTWARIFLPRHVLDHNPSSSSSPPQSPPSPTKPLPLIVNFHGGGFILLSASSTIFHDYCSNLAVDLNVIIVSIEYRLAPEHRLPAAYDDAMDALHWIKNTEDDWLRQFADFSTCFLMGDSAGGNIAYHAGLRAADCINDFQPLITIKGLILRQPYFGGTQRTESELRLVNDPVLPLCVTDLMWELALPVDVDRDHEYSNPTAESGSKGLVKIKEVGWRVLITGSDGDPLVDRQIELVKMMERIGVQVVGHFGVGDNHGAEVVDPSKAKNMLGVLERFIFSSN